MSDRRYVKAYIGWWEQDWINVLSAEAQLAWMKFQERGKSHGIGGSVPKFTLSTVARQWLQGEESVRQMLKAAELAGEIIDDGDHWSIVNWKRDQGDETGAIRQARFKQRQIGNAGNALGNGGNVEFKEKIGEEIKKETPLRGAKKERFTVPSGQEVADYARDIALPMTEARAFHDYQLAKGWKVGTAPMKDWKAALRTWKKNWSDRQAQPGVRNNGSAPPPRNLPRNQEAAP